MEIRPAGNAWSNARQWLELFTTIRALGSSRRIRSQLEDLVVQLGERDVVIETAPADVLSDIINVIRYVHGQVSNREQLARTRNKLFAAREKLRTRKRVEHAVLIIAAGVFSRLIAQEAGDAGEVVDSHRAAWHHALMSSSNHGRRQRVLLPDSRGVRAAAVDSLQRLIRWEETNRQRGRGPRIKAVRKLIENIRELESSTCRGERCSSSASR